MANTPISDHAKRAKDRLAQQYKGKPKLEAILDALNVQTQELEDVGQSLIVDRWIDSASGAQLDRFGEIVVQERQGFSDDFYRVLLKVKIGQNLSNGEPQTIQSTIALLAGATLVHYQNIGNAHAGLSIDSEIAEELVSFIYQNMERVIAAGVRLDFIVTFDQDESFSFAGIGPVGLGFGSTSDPLEGGKFAFINRDKKPFSFDGDSTSSIGFGTILDPLAGGALQGL